MSGKNTQEQNSQETAPAVEDVVEEPSATDGEQQTVNDPTSEEEEISGDFADPNDPDNVSEEDTSGALELSDEEFEKEFEKLEQEEQEKDVKIEDEPQVPDNKPEPSSTPETKKPEEVVEPNQPETVGSESQQPAPEVKSDKPAEPAKQEDVPEKYRDAVAGYGRIMAPFKANGREIQVQNPDEAIKLMQMGAGYVRKMQELKPVMGLVKTLEKNNVTSEDELGFLMDLKNRNPEAIKKLVRDANLDPMEISTEPEDRERDRAYRPQSPVVSSAQVELDNTLDTVMASQGGREFLQDISTNWDQHSRAEAYKEPGIFLTLNEHREAGIYDQIMSVYERERALGNMRNTPVLHAYMKIGQIMTDQGLFADNNSANPPSQEMIPGNGINTTNGVATPQNVDPLQSSAANPANPALVANSGNASVENKPEVLAEGTRPAQKSFGNDGVAKKVAGVNQSTATTVPAKINPLAISDEDFLNSDELAKLISS